MNSKGGTSSSGAAREGSDGSKIYCCMICTRFEVSTYEGWLWHLGSREHQLGISKLKIPLKWKNAEFRLRCISVHGIRGLTSREVLEYLGHWGEIEDFEYIFANKGENGTINHCLCLYREREAARASINEPHHEFKGKTLSIRLKRDPQIPFPKEYETEADRRKRKAQNEPGWGTPGVKYPRYDRSREDGVKNNKY